MKVLVTGGAGYIGSVTTEMLCDAGHEIVVFDNLERGHRAAVDPRATLVEGDLRDADAIREAMTAAKPDAVMHFAAYALVGEAMEQPELYFRNNVTGGINLADAMLAAGVSRIVFSSTCATYGEPDAVPITEEETQQPTNPYGESKLMFERVLAWYRELHAFQPVFLRYFNASGASGRYGEDHQPETHLIPIVLQVAQGRRDCIRVFGDDYDTPDGTCIRDYIHIRDLAQAHMRALTGDMVGAFNLGTENGNSVREIIEAAREVTGHPIPEEVAPRRPGDPPRLVADASRAREILGWQPECLRVHDIIESAWAWHRAHPEGYAE